MHIPAPNSWEELGAEKFSLSPSGTGPFKVIKWTDNGVRMNSFDESWRPSKNVKYLTIFEVPERIGRVQALLSDQTDIAIGLAYDDIEIIERHIGSYKKARKWFKQPSTNADGSIYADQGWHHVTNIQIACDLNDDSPLEWMADSELDNINRDL